VAQFGSASGWGPEGRWFKSSRPDIEVVIPARNEAAALPHLIEELRDELGPSARLIVVDNASSDGTASVAGADLVVNEPRVGKGYAVMRGIRAAGARRLFLCDADLRGVPGAAIRTLLSKLEETGSPVARLAIGRSAEEAPTTNLVALPLLAKLGLNGVREPLGGLAAVDSEFVLAQHLPGGWGFDVALTAAALRAGHQLFELPVESVIHRRRPEKNDYTEMAAEVVASLLGACAIADWDHSSCTRCRT
jgi:glucosyl-3-phosphoglycerate synthase